MRYLLKGRKPHVKVFFVIEAVPRLPPSPGFPYGRSTWNPEREFKDRGLMPISVERIDENERENR